MSRQRDKGTRFENAVEAYLRRAFGDEEGAIHVERRHGSKDEGDIHGLSSHGRRIVVECKSCASYRLADWIAQAEEEAGNADADLGIVVFKRRGVGLGRMGGQYCLMTLGALAGIMGGDAGHEHERGAGSTRRKPR